ncbi:MAG: hypothetical protein IT426_10115 [Pirellulales bacterium]|nr:hypothetical protein [Pirellulales bacterium]
MFSAYRLSAIYVIPPKNGPVPDRGVNAYDKIERRTMALDPDQFFIRMIVYNSASFAKHSFFRIDLESHGFFGV